MPGKPQIQEQYDQEKAAREADETESHRDRWTFRDSAVLFIILDIVSVLAFAYTARGAAECSDPLVGTLAQSACTEYTTIHDLGFAGLLIFTLLAIVSFISSGREKQSRHEQH